MTPAKKSAALMQGPLQAILHLRFASAIGFMLISVLFRRSVAARYGGLGAFTSHYRIQ